MKALPAPLSSGSSLPISFHRQRNKAKPHNAPWLLFSMLLFVPAFSIVATKSYGVCSPSRSQAHRRYYNQAVSLLAHMLPLNFLTKPPLWRPFTFISSECHATLKCVIREDNMITQVENTLYRRTGIELREFKSTITIYCRASNNFLSTSGCFWPTVKLLIAVSFMPPALSQNTSSQSQQGCVNANNEPTQSPVLC